jgi:hypothetical protein
MYLDSWYTSPDIFDKLCQERMDYIGTLTLNKTGAPEKIKVVKLKKGESVARQ